MIAVGALMGLKGYGMGYGVSYFVLHVFNRHYSLLGVSFEQVTVLWFAFCGCGSGFFIAFLQFIEGTRGNSG
jgi:hypothetical protein